MHCDYYRNRCCDIRLRVLLRMMIAPTTSHHRRHRAVLDPTIVRHRHHRPPAVVVIRAVPTISRLTFKTSSNRTFCRPCRIRIRHVCRVPTTVCNGSRSCANANSNSLINRLSSRVPEDTLPVSDNDASCLNYAGKLVHPSQDHPVWLSASLCI